MATVHFPTHAHRVVAHSRWARITENGGCLFVAVESTGEHHSTLAAEARRFVAEELGAGYRVGNYVGRNNYRNTAGYPSFARVYRVFSTEVEHVNYPHHPGYLHDCPACDARCHCTPGNAECVFEGEHNGSAEA